jgi:hypothetical protein
MIGLNRPANWAIGALSLALVFSPVSAFAEGGALAEPPSVAAPEAPPAETGSVDRPQLRGFPGIQFLPSAPRPPVQDGPGCSYRDNKLELLV